MVILGAAAADPECIKGWNDFGVICLQGYGSDRDLAGALCRETCV